MTTPFTIMSREGLPLRGNIDAPPTRGASRLLDHQDFSQVLGRDESCQAAILDDGEASDEHVISFEQFPHLPGSPDLITAPMSRPGAPHGTFGRCRAGYADISMCAVSFSLPVTRMQ